MYIQMCMLCVSPEWERGNDTSGRDAQEVNCEGQRVNSTSNRPTMQNTEYREQETQKAKNTIQSMPLAYYASEEDLCTGPGG